MIIYKSLPPHVRGLSVCVAEPEGDFYTIILNENLSHEMQEKTYLHEKIHINCDHFHDERDIEEKETEARLGKNNK